MVLQGAEILLYPTAIGSEPQDQELDSREHWKRVMQGHAGANLVGSFAEPDHLPPKFHITRMFSLILSL